ncbi:hypothetical protein BC827DRAFT_1385481 [Russula dissimulans]|nr:hypothetical protein BC827DRAFT_1385481 [Russula dissimulans]
MDRCLREIRWEVMPPAQWAEKEGGMRLPFFTDDVTPREFRGPTRPPSNTDHPNGALIIAHLRVLAPPLAFPGFTSELTTIIGEESINISPTERAPWLLDLPGQVALKRHLPLTYGFKGHWRHRTLPSFLVLNQHDICAQIVHQTRTINRTCKVEAY